MIKLIFPLQMAFFLAFGMIAGASYMEAYELRVAKIEREAEARVLLSLSINLLSQIPVREESL